MTQTATLTTTHTPLVLSLEQFVKSLEGSKSSLTVTAYRSDLRQFFAWLTETDYTVSGVERITCGHIEDYLAHLRDKGQTGTTRARKLISLQVFFAYLIDRGILPHSRAEKMKRPSREQKTKHFLRPDEYSRVLAEAAGDPRDYCILQVFLQTGIRVSELIALSLADYDRQQKTLTVHGKGSQKASG